MVLLDWDETKAKIFPEADSSLLKSGLMDENSEFESDIKEVVPLRQLKAGAGKILKERSSLMF